LEEVVVVTILLTLLMVVVVVEMEVDFLVVLELQVNLQEDFIILLAAVGVEHIIQTQLLLQEDLVV
tara:strand:- start:176 stop:373 length:198 start_codon:yes stop_codon:yes gene_type:complete